jgi:transglutaminase-like putative cysteine protease
MTHARRRFLQSTVALGSASALSALVPAISHAQSTAPAQTGTGSAPLTDAARRFDPLPGQWRSFELTTRVDIIYPKGTTQVWLPLPSVESAWQQVLGNRYSSNGQVRLASDGEQGVRMLYAEFAPSVTAPYVELVSTVRTQNRKLDWQAAGTHAAREDAHVQRYWTRPTALIPTDGIVRKTAMDAIKGAKSDVAKVNALYDWVVANAWREPKVRGCGEGDIKTMLETGNLGGKCADINALFVGLCRSVGVPARDVYGIRLSPSAFGYKELSGNSANLKSAQHCRAEVYLQAHGWTAMDPADVAKVMRLETPQWLKDTRHPVVAPINQALRGGWEGNWLAYNTGHDVRLPQAKASSKALNFMMYPVAETADGRFDSYAPDDFKYQISAKELKA